MFAIWYKPLDSFVIGYSTGKIELSSFQGNALRFNNERDGSTLADMLNGMYGFGKSEAFAVIQCEVN